MFLGPAFLEVTMTELQTMLSQEAGFKEVADWLQAEVTRYERWLAIAATSLQPTALGPRNETGLSRVDAGFCMAALPVGWHLPMAKVLPGGDWRLEMATQLWMIADASCDEDRAWIWPRLTVEEVKARRAEIRTAFKKDSAFWRLWHGPYTD